MDFNEKLRELRKQKGLTQEELAQVLYVSRTAVSKWESGRGYPSIDSLKAIADYFSVTVDELLSGEKLLTIAREEQKQVKSHTRDLVFGLLNLSVALLLVLPCFRQVAEGVLQVVPLWSLTAVASYMRFLYIDVIGSIVVYGILFIVLQNGRWSFWQRYKHAVSLALNSVGLLLFALGSQPYAVTFLFFVLSAQVLWLLKK